MTVIENTVVVHRPPEEVFDALVDMRNELKWNPDVQLMEKITDGPVGLGTKFRAKWKQSQPLIVECTHYQRPHSWTYHNGGPVDVDVDITVSPQDNGSVVVARFDASPNGWFKLVFPIFVLIMKRAERANAGHIKKFLEDSDSSSTHTTSV